jgi:hypothetical protein
LLHWQWVILLGRLQGYCFSWSLSNFSIYLSSCSRSSTWYRMPEKSKSRIRKDNFKQGSNCLRFSLFEFR